MKILPAFVLFFSLALTRCINLRNLKLMDTEKYQKLCNVGNSTLYQIFSLQVDFGGKTYKDLSDENYRISLEVRESDSEIPKYENKVIIEVNNGQAKLPDIDFPSNVNLELLGTKHTLKEEFNIFSHTIAHAFDLENVKGSVIIYKNEDIDNVKAQSRFRMMVNSTNDQKVYGWVEITIEDKNDKDSIIYKIKQYYNKLKQVIAVILPELKLVSETISTASGILKDIKAALSSFNLKLNWLTLFIIMNMLLF